MSPKRPNELIDPWRARIDLAGLADLLFTKYRGRARRVKLKHLGVELLGVVPDHGSGPEVALREAIGQLRDEGAPVGTEAGPDGGVWWLETEAERMAVLAQLEAQHRTVGRMIEKLRAASLEGWTRRQGTLL